MSNFTTFSAEWKKTSMGHIGTIYGGLSGKSKVDFGGGNARYVTFLGVLENVILDVRHTERVHVGRGESQNPVLKGDLLFNASSETPGDLAIGAVMGEQLDNLYLNSFCFGFRIHDKNRHVPLFLAYFFRGTVGRDIMNALAQGATRYNMSKSQFRALELSIPCGDEQHTIAKVLSDVDGLLNALEALIAKKRAIKQAVMQQLLTDKTRLPGFSGAWETKRFGELFKRLNGNSHKIQTSEYSVNGLHPVIDQGQDTIVAYSDRTEKLFKCPVGGVIVFGDHTRIVKFIDVDFLIGADGTQLLAMRGTDVAIFLFYQLSTKDIPNTGYNRHFKFLKDLTFKIPKPEEQHAIASVLSDMNAEIATLEQRRDKTHAIKQGMMQQLLTGRLRLVKPKQDLEIRT